MRCDIRPKHTIAVIMIMEECVKLNGKTIVCMNWSPVTPLLHISKFTKAAKCWQKPDPLIRP